MSFIDGVQQYQNSVAAAAQGVSQTKDAGAVRQISAQTQGMIPGKVFEGTVTEIKNGQVTIGLNDGSSISARMDAGVSLEKGQPMLFEVKSNNGEQIAIRPVMAESAQNPTLLKALEAAGIKVNDRNLSMVNEMMAEKLPINRQSLLQMMRTLSSFPKADIQTLVQMQKLGFVITEDSLNQFQNYKNGQQAILPEMSRLMDGIAELPGQILGSSGEGATAQTPSAMLGAAAQTPAAMLGLQQQILGIILGDGQQMPDADGTGIIRQDSGEGSSPPGAVDQNVVGESLQQEIQAPGQPVADSGIPGGISGEAQMPGETSAEGVLSGKIAAEAQIPDQAAGETQITGQGAEEMQAVRGSSGEVQSEAPMTAAQILSAEQQSELTSILEELPGTGKEQLLSDGKLNTNLTAGELLKQLMGALNENGMSDAASMQKLFRSDAYKSLLKQAMTEQWMLTPEKLKEEGAVKEFYQRLSGQLSELQQTLTQAGKEGATLAKSAQSVQSSLDFMNQVNQLYTYVQLPLKLQNQNVHSDLYVYTNKKNLRQKEGELTALLHLDMDHLGVTDIFVKLMGVSVQTEFYFEDELSCRLISQYSDDLIKRLEEKGYSCEVKVENRRKKQDFVQDFLERENPPGKLQRYSFDVKA